MPDYLFYNILLPLIFIYTRNITNRLTYITNLIFNEILKTPFAITDGKNDFIKVNAAKINYSDEIIPDTVQIKPSGLLFENTIKNQKISVSDWDNMKIFFQNDCEDIPFDIFSASFYLVSRYEEYLPFTPDMHGRFEANQSLAYESGFLDIPIINEWAEILKKILLKKYLILEFDHCCYQYISSIDIDRVWAYLHKGFIKNTGGLCNDLLHGNINKVKSRWKTLTGKAGDPYFTFKFLDQIEEQYGIRHQYFFQVGRNSRYDKNIPPNKAHFKNILKTYALNREIGVHPSYYSYNKEHLIKKEVNILQKIIHSPVYKSRQHYLNLKLPETYEYLEKAGIKEDYSMGYGSATGFRAGTCTPFKFYNLKKEKTMEPIVYPFQVMDVTLHSYLNYNPDDAIKKTRNIIEKIRKAKGIFISIWHNQNINDMNEWKGWKRVFEETIKIATEKE